ncbi:hypothetical protein AWRI1631_153140 [Saccharomyces cerevisiae AWRI1631]|uniref:Uncharacterized protein n=1 Tax=Saccharomyces cerevisiae (strain AWRI1631) TaxID=545124 RepID=B5VS46_YEAS6|nr:hypothetical protein AWRI1631_153140 [Saccharomyces cerevisiae AWRI1631]
MRLSTSIKFTLGDNLCDPFGCFTPLAYPIPRTPLGLGDFTLLIISVCFVVGLFRMDLVVGKTPLLKPYLAAPFPILQLSLLLLLLTISNETIT